VEKPLLSINGKPMIEYICKAVEQSREINNLIIATSKHTPQTKEYAKESGLKVIETPGNGYIEDLRFLLDELNETKQNLSDIDDIIVTVTADLPLITGEILDEVLQEYKNCVKPAMCVAVPLEFFTNYNIKPHLVMGAMVPSGLNILRRNNNQQDEEVLELRKFELALNINSPEDLISLEKYFEFKAFKQAIK
jgi:adenosylcobinamide-phosphate guanylyltransferase